MPKSKASNDFAFIKKLAANDRVTREEGLETLRKFLGSAKTLDDLDVQKIWKGLYYTMWFSDRPRSQQRLADDMAGLLEIVRDHNFFQFLDAFWVIMGREWDGLDQHRIDKFLLLLRRYVAGTFRRLRAEDWQDDWLEGYQIVMAHVPLNPKDSKVPNAIRLHMTDIFLDELEKIVSENDGPDGIPFEALLKPVRDLAQDCPLKFVRERTTKDVLEDPRLVEWGVVDLPQTNEPHQDSDTDDSEWGGLN